MMAMGSLSDSDDDFNPEINTTPLVDVMLVLLIIFMITIPVMQNNVKVDLPRATSQPNSSTGASIRLTIDASGTMYWNDAAVDPTQLRTRIAEAARQNPQPELHLRAERTTPYEKVAQVMAAAQSGGLEKIGFITEPQPK
jgi:biopolymer transport protein ExbD